MSNDSIAAQTIRSNGQVQSGGMAVLDRLDARWSLSEDEAELIDLLKRVVAERIAPKAEAFDETSEFPAENLKLLTDIGCNRIFIPEEYGGLSASYLCLLRVVEELSRGCPSTAISWATTYHAVSPVIRFGTEEQKSRYLPQVAGGALAALAITEPSGGSDVRAVQTTLRQDGDEVVVEGGKVFITNGDVAALLVVFGNWVGSTAKSPLTAVIVDGDAPGLEVIRRESKLGHRASSTVQLAFDDLRLPASNVLGAPGQGFELLLSALNRSRPTISAHALGIARAALDLAVKHANDRTQFGKRILDFQGVQFEIANLASRLIMCRAMLSHVGSLVQDGAADDGIEASMLKVAATDLAVDTSSMAIQLMGGQGYVSGSGAERLFRDAKVTQIWEGANELHRERIGRSFLHGKSLSMNQRLASTSPAC